MDPKNNTMFRGPEELGSHLLSGSLKSRIVKESVFKGPDDSVPYQHYIEQVKG
jgi:hypothetical protein